MDHRDRDVTCLKASAAGPRGLVMRGSINLKNKDQTVIVNIQYLVIFHFLHINFTVFSGIYGHFSVL